MIEEAAQNYLCFDYLYQDHIRFCTIIFFFNFWGPIIMNNHIIPPVYYYEANTTSQTQHLSITLIISSNYMYHQFWSYRDPLYDLWYHWLVCSCSRSFQQDVQILTQHYHPYIQKHCYVWLDLILAGFATNVWDWITTCIQTIISVHSVPAK